MDPAALAVFLIVTFQQPGEEPYVEETKEDSVAICMVKAAHVLDRAVQAKSEDAHRISARCLIEWPGHDPA